jgi:hypothetical protein
MFDELKAIAQPTLAEPATPPQLDEILALIAEDATRNSEQYLDETVVPHGGE